MENLERKKTESSILTSPTEDELLQIREVEKHTFDWEVSDEDLDELVRKIKDSNNLTAIIKNSEQEVVGYIVSVPSMNIDDEILEEDTSFVKSENNLYIETFAIAKQYRGDVAQLRNLIGTLTDKAREEGYSILSAHVPLDHFPVYERYGAIKMRTLENWFDSGEDHYYIESTL